MNPAPFALQDFGIVQGDPTGPAFQLAPTGFRSFPGLNFNNGENPLAGEFPGKSAR